MNIELIKRVISSIILIPFSLFFITKGSLILNFFLIIVLILSVSEWNKMTNNINLKILGLLFLILSFYSIYSLRNNIDEGLIYIYFVLLICISTDIGGFVFGKIFKGPKLTSISPNKTYAGIIGSYVLTLTFITLFINFFEADFLNNEIAYLYFLIIIISTISQLGDLTLSFFKRKSKIKDTGNIIPGHGGVLDRIDGMIFAFPFAHLIFYLNFL